MPVREPSHSGGLQSACTELELTCLASVMETLEQNLKVTIDTPDRRQWRHSGAFTVNFEQISLTFLVFLLLALKFSNYLLKELIIFFFSLGAVHHHTFIH